jgi:ubiquinone/menaquinone biosynthesis C-methylase UbiE
MRIYDTPVALDYEATERFFASRGQRIAEVGALSAVLYQDQNPELAARRSAHEIELISPKLTSTGQRINVLDLGCGTGRWAHSLHSVVSHYVGLDFCEDFLKAARNACDAQADPARFQFLAANLALPLPELTGAPFKTVIMAGVLLYLNDDDAERLLDEACGLLAKGGVLYLREPLGVKQRLSLCNHYSAELNAKYSSLYRSKAEFGQMVDVAARWHGLILTESAALYPQELDNRSDTRQFYYLLERP